MTAPRIRKLSEVLNIEDLRTLARRKVPAFAYSYVDSGVEDQETLAHNRDVFRQIRLVPRQLRDVSRIDTATQYFQQPVALPFAICPTGYNGMLTHHGDLKLARAARAFGIPFVSAAHTPLI